MAIAYRGRFKPDPFSDKSIAANVAADGSSGTVYFRVQIVQYDDAVVTAQNYKPGHPDTEAELTIVWEAVLQEDLSVFVGMSAPQRNAYFDAMLDTWMAMVKPTATAIAPVVLAAQRRPPRAIP